MTTKKTLQKYGKALGHEGGEATKTKKVGIFAPGFKKKKAKPAAKKVVAKKAAAPKKKAAAKKKAAPKKKVSPKKK